MDVLLFLQDIMGEHKLEISEKEALEEAADYFAEFDIQISYSVEREENTQMIIYLM